MKISTLTSDPAVALELGRRLAKAARRPKRSRFTALWSQLFRRSARWQELPSA